MPDTKTRISTLGRVVVVVSDQDRALDFYVGKLGFEKRTDIPYGNGERWIEVAPAGAVTTIAIVPPAAGTDMKPGVQTGIIFDVADIDGLHADLKAQGVDVDDEVKRWGGPVPPMFWFRDQDGNTLSAVQPTA